MKLCWNLHYYPVARINKEEKYYQGLIVMMKQEKKKN
jgi:hypothetical protein